MEANATTQDNCRRLVDNHVYHNVSYLVQELSKNEKYMDELKKEVRSLAPKPLEPRPRFAPKPLEPRPQPLPLTPALALNLTRTLTLTSRLTLTSTPHPQPLC